MSHAVVIVGAGFSLAANARFAGEARQHGRQYPLVSELAHECFGKTIPPEEIERSFSQAIRDGNRQPVNRLVETIQLADYYVGYSEAQAPDSPYKEMLDVFEGAHFISFNYDALLEIILLKRGSWNPSDGFGVPVETGGVLSGTDEAPAQSTTTVLHLHGSVLLYPVEMDYQTKRNHEGSMTWAKLRSEPRFLFDPDSLANCFVPFKRANPGLGYRPPEHRIIAPVPDKAHDLDAPYVVAVYARALDLVRQASRIIAIGYRFAECDRASFKSLLEAAAGARIPLQVVNPDAEHIASRIRLMQGGLQVAPTSLSFSEWAAAGFEGTL